MNAIISYRRNHLFEINSNQWALWVYCGKIHQKSFIYKSRNFLRAQIRNIFHWIFVRFRETFFKSWQRTINCACYWISIKIQDCKLESIVFAKIYFKAINNHTKFEIYLGQEWVFHLLIDDFEDQKDDSERFCLLRAYLKFWGFVSWG